MLSMAMTGEPPACPNQGNGSQASQQIGFWTFGETGFFFSRLRSP
jgi:hypothetical protein